MSEDPRIEQTISLLQECWGLLRRLQDLKMTFPMPREVMQSSMAPVDHRLSVYSLLARRVEASLRFALRAAVTDLEIGGHWDIRREILPPSAKGRTDEQWLRWLDQQLGPEPLG